MEPIYVVVKPFNTRTRRLSVGEEVGAFDIDHVLGAEDWLDRGFLAVKSGDPQPAPDAEF